MVPQVIQDVLGTNCSGIDVAYLLKAFLDVQVLVIVSFLLRLFHGRGAQVGGVLWSDGLSELHEVHVSISIPIK